MAMQARAFMPFGDAGQTVRRLEGKFFDKLDNHPGSILAFDEINLQTGIRMKIMTGGRLARISNWKVEA
jgi:hypothetical protein